MPSCLTVSASGRGGCGNQVKQKLKSQREPCAEPMGKSRTILASFDIQAATRSGLHGTATLIEQRPRSRLLSSPAPARPRGPPNLSAIRARGRVERDETAIALLQDRMQSAPAMDHLPSPVARTIRT